ncbi:RagB/SusD family nutrient uptake outer membrane protein [Larkinella bovis]|uniref:RagB/SusD family nutrient uptake outer membrane protein n=1 Tax=Larkinella bovis TaxID=683041 RepID=A0ABW0ICZ0_9BACT
MTFKSLFLRSVASIILVTSLSCSNQFDELSLNPNQKTLEGITTPQAYNTFIQGIYFYVATARNLGAQGRNVLFSRGDESSSGADYAAFGQNAINPDYYSLKEVYQYMYTVAGQSAIALDIASRINFPDPKLRDAYLGEAHFLRAFAHYFLLTNFRQVALIKEPAYSPADYARPINTPLEVWNFIIEDLNTAKTLLPTKDYWTGTNVGRISAGGAAAFLGKVYLYMSGIESIYGSEKVNKYSEAAREFGDIMSGKYGTYTLMADYNHNFDVAHENNNEALVEFQFFGSRVNTEFNPGVPNSGVSFDYRGMMIPFSNQFITNLRHNREAAVVHDWVYDTFVQSKDKDGNTDPRMFGTILFDDSKPEIKAPTVNGVVQKVIGLSGKTWNQMYPPTATANGFATVDRIFAPYKAAYKKWIDLTLPSDADPGSPALWARRSYCNGVNYRYIRYADVLLMYAEAVLMGGTATAGSAQNALNAVRERSNMPIIPATLENIKHERILELSLEGHRFMDLLRWGTLVNTMKNREATDPNFKKFGNGSPNSSYVPFQENKNEWLPIPAVDMQSNPNIKQNNPGW